MEAPLPLSAPASARSTDLLVNHIQTARQYHDCKLKHRSLPEWALSPGRAGGGDE